MVTLNYHPVALTEIQDAAAFYENCRAGLGKAFLETIERDIKKIARNPLHYRKLGHDFRRCLVRRFPYGIIYRVDGDTVFVAAVMHLHREPGYWRERLQK